MMRVIGLASIIALSAAADPACTLHVNASGSLAQAAAQLAALPSDRPVVVCLGPGAHRAAGLRLGPEHNSPGGVIWRPADPTRGASVVGGLPLTRWYRCDDGEHCPWPEWHGVWVHMMSDVPGIPPDGLPIRQLWVNGTRAARTAQSTDGLRLEATATGYTAGAATGWAAEDLVELRWPSQIRNWIEPRCVVTAVSGGNITVAPECWAALTARNGGKTPPGPLWVGNVPGPPGPGQFYATPEYVFYRPLSQTPFQEPINAWAPVPGPVLAGEGLVNHAWHGIRFAHGTWRQPSQPAGYVPSQSLVSAAGEPVGAVAISHSLNISFIDCSFENIGAAYALSIGQSSQSVVVSGCRFRDCSGGALKLGNVNDSRALSTVPAEWDVSYLVQNNMMSDIALEFRGAATVFAGYVADTTIARNTILNTGYTGISLGWGWGTHVTGPQTFARNNHITGNRLVGVMSALNDGGCTYTLGPQPNSTVSGNYCRQDRAKVVGCFYHDNGSRYFSTFMNVADSSPAPCVYLQGCCNSPAYDIAVKQLWCRDTSPVENQCAKQNCTIDAGSLHLLPAGAAWPEEAQAIINASGATL